MEFYNITEDQEEAKVGKAEIRLDMNLVENFITTFDVANFGVRM